MPRLDDIWYVDRARAEGAHGDLDGGQRSSEVKWDKLCAMATRVHQTPHNFVKSEVSICP